MATVIIAKNNTGSAILLEELGAEIPGSGQVTLTDTFTKIEIATGYHLKSLVQAGTITINDGSQDLSIADGLKHLNFKTEYEDPESTFDATTMIPHTLESHTDVSQYPANAQVLKYNSSTGLWEFTGLTHTGSGPPDSTTEVWIQPVVDELYHYNVTYGDWLSSAKNIYTYGRSGNVSGAYLGIGGWSTGGYYYIPTPGGVITGLYCKADSGIATKGFEVHINGASQYPFNLTSYLFENHDLAIEVPSGASLQIWCSPVDGPVKDVVCQVTLHWRVPV